MVDVVAGAGLDAMGGEAADVKSPKSPKPLLCRCVAGFAELKPVAAGAEDFASKNPPPESKEGDAFCWTGGEVRLWKGTDLAGAACGAPKFKELNASSSVELAVREAGCAEPNPVRDWLGGGADAGLGADA